MRRKNMKEASEQGSDASESGGGSVGTVRNRGGRPRKFATMPAPMSDESWRPVVSHEIEEKIIALPSGRIFNNDYPKDFE
jgi:hypothetical protein